MKSSTRPRNTRLVGVVGAMAALDMLALAATAAVQRAPATLPHLGRKHGTDKYEHGYLSVYAERFDPLRSSVRSILELGVFYGASLKMWRDYFAAATVVCGIDDFSGILGAWRYPAGSQTLLPAGPQTLVFAPPPRDQRSGPDANRARTTGRARRRRAPCRATSRGGRRAI